MAHVPEREHLQQRLCIGGKAQIWPIFGPTSTLLGENFSAAGCICGQAAMPCMIKASYNPVHACMPLLGWLAQCPNLFACAAITLAALCTCHAWKNLLPARLWYIVRACKQCYKVTMECPRNRMLPSMHHVDVVRVILLILLYILLQVGMHAYGFHIFAKLDWHRTKPYA